MNFTHTNTHRDTSSHTMQLIVEIKYNYDNQWKCAYVFIWVYVTGKNWYLFYFGSNGIKN